MIFAPWMSFRQAIWGAFGSGFSFGGLLRAYNSSAISVDMVSTNTEHLPKGPRAQSSAY